MFNPLSTPTWLLGPTVRGDLHGTPAIIALCKKKKKRSGGFLVLYFCGNVYRSDRLVVAALFLGRSVVCVNAIDQIVGNITNRRAHAVIL